MTPVPVAVTVDNMGNAADIGRGTAAQADPDEPGLRTGFPAIERMLDRFGMPATFFVEGWNALHHPEKVTALHRQGHEIALHGWVHEPWAALDEQRERAILAAGRAALQTCAGRVAGFRAPGGERSARTLSLLAEHGFSYDASLDAKGFRVDASGVACLPFAWPAVDWWWYHVRRPPADPADWRRGWQDLLDRAKADRRPLVLVAHARVSGVDPVRAALLEDLLAGIEADRELRAVHMRDLADLTATTAAQAADRPGTDG